ncbi:glycosyltransferase [Microvirga soli]|uniref:glycosyltransferase n=1 Tax=Microvirga soli TaxID=1854496 RepID=UPI00191CA5F5|nr:glycosyltransferase [Microvirga soli]
MSQLIGHTERVEFGAGFVYLSGWVAYREKSPVSGPVTISIPGSSTGLVPKLLYRQDLEAAGIAGGHAAFQIAIPLRESGIEHPVVVASIDGIETANLVSSLTKLARFVPFGTIDRTRGGLIEGWVFDPAIRLSDASVRLLLDGKHEVRLSHNKPRPDVPYWQDVFGFEVRHEDVVARIAQSLKAASLDSQNHTLTLLSGGEIIASVDVDLGSGEPISEELSQSSTAPFPPISLSDAPQSRTKTEKLISPADPHEPPSPEERQALASETANAPLPAQTLTAYIETVFRSGRSLLVSGWTSCSDKSAVTGPIRAELIGVQSDSIVVGALNYREDIRAAGIADGYAGFMAAFRLDREQPLPQALRLTPSAAIEPLTIQFPSQPVNPSSHLYDLSVSEHGLRGALLSIDQDAHPSSVTLRLLGRLDLAIPLVADSADARAWSAHGVVRSHFAISCKDLIAKIRGLEPRLILDEDALSSVALMINGHAAVIRDIALVRPAKGRLEIAQADRVSGWLVPSEKSSTTLELDVLVDGVRYATFPADRNREDLVRAGLTDRGGGFRFEPANPKFGESKVTIQVAQALTTTFLEGANATLDLPSAKCAALGNLFANLTRARAAGVSVIVPVYNAADDLARCLESLVRNTTMPCRLIVINDCSPDPKVDAILATYRGHSNIDIHQNESNLGFTRTINRGIELAGDDDVVFLNSDTIVTPGWLQGMQAAAYSDLRVATVTPTSNNAGAFNVPEIGVDNALPAGFSVDDFARLVRHASAVSYPRVPTGNGFCLYVRRDAINEIGRLDEAAFPVGYGEENDFCMRAGRAGLLNIIDDRTFVYHKRSASFGDSKDGHYAAGRAVIEARYPEYKRLTSLFTTGPEILSMRWRVRKAIVELGDAQLAPRPRYAFVISTQTGGTPQTNRDLMTTLADRYEPWVLRCDSKAVEIYRYDPTGDVLVETVTLATRIEPALHTSPEYNDVIASMLVRYGFEFVHIRHLGWHGIDLPRVCRTLGIPVVLSLHDFYTTCPATKLLDENRVYCAGTCTPTAGDCSVELWTSAQFPRLKHGFVHRWREMFGPVLETSDALVTTAESAKEVFTSVYPQVLDKDFRVIPHGRSFEEMSLDSEEPNRLSRMRILIPGNISAAKGAELISAVVDADRGETLEFHILGDPGRLKARAGLVVHGRYKRDEFGALVKAIRPNIGAVLSVWPETYCHTLTEMWATGVPVVGIDCGAVGERIKAHGGGWLLPLGSTANDLYRLLLSIRDDAASHQACVAEITSWQNGYSRVHTIDHMGLQYEALYRDVIERKRPFHPATGSDLGAAPI